MVPQIGYGVVARAVVAPRLLVASASPPHGRHCAWDWTTSVSSYLAPSHMLEPATAPPHSLRPTLLSGAHLDEFDVCHQAKHWRHPSAPSSRHHPLGGTECFYTVRSGELMKRDKVFLDCFGLRNQAWKAPIQTPLRPPRRRAAPACQPTPTLPAVEHDVSARAGHPPAPRLHLRSEDRVPSSADIVKPQAAAEVPEPSAELRAGTATATRRSKSPCPKPRQSHACSTSPAANEQAEHSVPRAPVATPRRAARVRSETSRVVRKRQSKQAADDSASTHRLPKQASAPRLPGAELHRNGEGGSATASAPAPKQRGRRVKAPNKDLKDIKDIKHTQPKAIASQDLLNGVLREAIHPLQPLQPDAIPTRAPIASPTPPAPVPCAIPSEVPPGQPACPVSGSEGDVAAAPAAEQVHVEKPRPHSHSAPAAFNGPESLESEYGALSEDGSSPAEQVPSNSAAARHRSAALPSTKPLAMQHVPHEAATTQERPPNTSKPRWAIDPIRNPDAGHVASGLMSSGLKRCQPPRCPSRSILLGQPHDQSACSIAICGKRSILVGHLPTVERA